MTRADLQEIDAVRRFNRLYTRRIGVLEERLLASEFSLAEARVLYELAHRPAANAKAIGEELGLDPGYLSRILASFQRKGLIARRPSVDDGRRSDLALTEKGREKFLPLESMSRDAVRAMLQGMSPQQRLDFLQATRRIEQALGEPSKTEKITLRSFGPGDMGWIVSRHGEVYAREFGWDARFEAMVARIAAEFIENYNAKREGCWIAERAGHKLGSVCLVEKSRDVAKLRLLLVEQKARGTGAGRTLVERCIEFAREKEYKKITLWTQSMLAAARGLYRATGFKLIESEKHDGFGTGRLTGETWELKL